MRAALLFSAAFAVGIVTYPSVASAELPEYAELPSGHATAPPEGAAPASIPAHEKVPGFFAAIPSFGGRVKGAPNQKAMAKALPAPTYVMIVGTPEQVKRIEAVDHHGARTTDDITCFSQVHRFRREMSAPMPDDEEDSDDDGASRPPFPDWDEGMSDSAPINMKTENNPYGGVTAVHSERFVSDAAGTRIEIVDAWVDPKTKGMRKITSATLPLKLVGSSRGLEVYAARDEREKARAVQFVVRAPKNLGDVGGDSLVATTTNGVHMSSNSCSHLRFAVNASDGAGDSALLRATLRLPDRAGADEERSDRDDGETEKRARLREAAVQLGVSKTKRDKAPVLSLTFGWSGRETSQVVLSRE